MAISEFKATCLAVLERVRRTGILVVVTRRGTVIAEVIPPFVAVNDASWLGSMRGTATIVGDLVAPVRATSAGFSHCSGCRSSTLPCWPAWP